MKKALAYVALSAAAVASQSASAVALSEDFEVIANIGAYSEYTMRGISFSQRKPVLQGYATLAHSSGLYAGVWSSGVDAVGVDASYEVDYYAGHAWQATDNVGIDIGYIDYTFPETSWLNSSEVYAVVKAFDFKFGTYYSSDYLGGEAYTYNYVGYSNDFLFGSIIDIRYGLVDYKDPVFISADGSTKESYREWEVKFSKNYLSLDWSLGYIDTNLSENECLSNVGDKESCSARLILGVSKAF